MSSWQAENRTVWLGLAGAYTASASETNHYVTKAGGTPCFPGTQVPTSNPPVCGVCGQQLSLVLQAYTPLSQAEHGTDAPERCLYVYGCTQPGCGKDAHAWRVFRCQLPAKPQHAPPGTTDHADPAQALPTAQPTSPSPDSQATNQQPTSVCNDGFADAGGFGFDDDFPADDATGTFDFSDLNSALDSSAQQQPTQPSRGRPAKVSAPGPEPQQPPATPSVVTCRAAVEASSHLILPEFYVTACEEPQGTQAGVRQHELDHIQELLVQYQLEEARAGEDTGVQAAGQASRTASRRPAREQQPPGNATPSTQQGSDDDGEGDEEAGAGSEGGTSGGWAVEEYEEDEVRGVDPGYLKFNQRLMRQPHQCVRYCWRGQLLWPKKQAPSPGTCAHCGAPRVFELQLLASLISLMMEATDLLQHVTEPGEAAATTSTGAGSGSGVAAAASSSSGSGDSSGAGAAAVAGQVPYGASITASAALTAAANWDMCTLAVFTCSKSCGVEGSQTGEEGGAGVWVEESVALVNEEECHLSMN